MYTQRDGKAGTVKEEFVQGNLQAGPNVHYALFTFCKLEKQLIRWCSFDSQVKRRSQESHGEEADFRHGGVRGRCRKLGPLLSCGRQTRASLCSWGENWGQEVEGRKILEAKETQS